jgi:hypothetical protein
MALPGERQLVLMFRTLEQPSAARVRGAIEEFLSEAVVQVDVGLEWKDVLQASAATPTSPILGTLDPGRPSAQPVTRLVQPEFIEQIQLFISHFDPQLFQVVPIGVVIHMPFPAHDQTGREEIFRPLMPGTRPALLGRVLIAE